jgi:lysine 2,3-aminomutase
VEERTKKVFVQTGKRDKSFFKEEEVSQLDEEPPSLSNEAVDQPINLFKSRRNLRLVFSQEEEDDSWQLILSKSITGALELAEKLPVNPQEVEKVISIYPMRINPYYLSLIKEPGDPLWLQAIPDPRELDDSEGIEDPLNEEQQSPVPNLTHRYPDRVLFLVSNQCPMYCRFCTRKRKVGRSLSVTEETISLGIEYISRHREIRDVILSGGDPLLLPDSSLEKILKALRRISHVEIIRIGTRVPCTLPQRITTRLSNMLKKYHPIYINTHFNHPREITQSSSRACTRLADAGIPLGCQTVLLRGVNDEPKVMKELMQALLKIRVRPYYLYQADLTKGTAHFRTSIKKGLEIMDSLRGYTSGLCIPHYVLDVPGGGGKIPILPNYVVREEGDVILLRNYKNNIYKYPINNDFPFSYSQPEVKDEDRIDI